MRDEAEAERRSLRDLCRSDAALPGESRLLAVEDEECFASPSRAGRRAPSSPRKWRQPDRRGEAASQTFACPDIRRTAKRSALRTRKPHTRRIAANSNVRVSVEERERSTPAAAAWTTPKVAQARSARRRGLTARHIAKKWLQGTSDQCHVPAAKTNAYEDDLSSRARPISGVATRACGAPGPARESLPGDDRERVPEPRVSCDERVLGAQPEGRRAGRGAATAMYAGPMPLLAIASARPRARTDSSVARSRFWSNHESNIRRRPAAHRQGSRRTRATSAGRSGRRTQRPDRRSWTGRSTPQNEVDATRATCSTRLRSIFRLADDLDRRPERDAVAQELESRLSSRTQPCETACPRRFGHGVPCTPTIPPPGQSVSFEYALVSNA